MWMIWVLLAGCSDETSVPLAAPLVHETNENTLMRHVEWVTTQRLKTSLEVACADSGRVTLNESIAAYEHLAYVGGLVEGESCEFWVVGEVDGVMEESARTTITLGEMPSFVPRPTPDVVPDEKYAVMTTLAREGPNSPGMAAIYDELGRPRWFTAPWGTMAPPMGIGLNLVSAGMSNTVGPTSVVMSGFSDTFPAKEVTMDGRENWVLDTVVHHQLTQATPDLLVGLTYDTCDGLQTGALTGFGFTDGAWEEVWSWRTCGSISPPVASQDWDHLNAFDEQDGVFVISARNQDAIYGVDASTKTLLWEIGANGDHVPTQDAAFIGQHGVKILNNGNILMLDNGDDVRPTTRVLEVALSPGEATVAWSVDLGLYAPILGDVHRLSDNQTLVAVGQVTDADAQILHLNNLGEIQAKLSFGDEWAVNRVAVVSTMPFGAILDHDLAWGLGI